MTDQPNDRPPVHIYVKQHWSGVYYGYTVLDRIHHSASIPFGNDKHAALDWAEETAKRNNVPAEFVFVEVLP